MAFLIWLGLALQAQPDKPAVVRIISPPDDPTEGLADVLLGSLGLSGIITVLAVLCGVLLGLLIFWLRSRSEPNQIPSVRRPS